MKSKKLLLLFLCSVFFFVLVVLFGSELNFELIQTLSLKSSQDILFQFRLPKAISAFTVGAILGLSGLSLQTLFKNPLAEPHILGTQSGASLGILLWIVFYPQLAKQQQFNNLFHLGPIFFSFVGALSVLIFIMGFFRIIKNASGLLLVGILFSTFINSIMSFITGLLEDNSLVYYFSWTIGSFDRPHGNQVVILALYSFVLLFVHLLHYRNFNIYLLGEENAYVLGVNTKLINGICILFAAMTSALTTAFCGPIGLIGLVAPHLGRLYLSSSNHLSLIPATFLIGGGIALFLQSVLNLLSHYPLNLNVIGGILSVPFILYIIVKNKR